MEQQSEKIDEAEIIPQVPDPHRQKLFTIGLAGIIVSLVILTALTSQVSKSPEAIAQREAQAQQRASEEQTKQVQAAAEQEAAQKAQQDQQKAADEANAKKRQLVIDELAPSYCVNHKKTEVSFSRGGEGWPTSSGNGFSAEECKTIIGKLYDLNPNTEQLVLTANHKVVVGMQSMFLTYSLGLPNEINSTYTGRGETQQRIYGSSLYGMYVYTDEEGTVTTIQN